MLVGQCGLLSHINTSSIPSPKTRARFFTSPFLARLEGSCVKTIGYTSYWQPRLFALPGTVICCLLHHGTNISILVSKRYPETPQRDLSVPHYRMLWVTASLLFSCKTVHNLELFELLGDNCLNTLTSEERSLTFLKENSLPGMWDLTAQPFINTPPQNSETSRHC